MKITNYQISLIPNSGYQWTAIIQGDVEAINKIEETIESIIIKNEEEEKKND